MKIDTYSPTIRRKEMDAVLTTMVGDRVGPGQQCERFLQLAKEYCHFDFALALRSPAEALRVALKVLQLEEGSAVLISALSPAYYATVIGDLGLEIVYADVDESSLNLTVDTVQKAITPQVRVVLIHHVLGYMPDMPLLVALGLPLIEDCSRSFGSKFSEQAAGSFGTLTILGLEEQDLLTAGGGALLYANAKRDALVLKNSATLPSEFKLPDMNAALASVQLKESERNREKRKELADICIQSSLRNRHKRPVSLTETEYNNYTFPLILETGAKEVVQYAAKKDICVDMAFADTVIGINADVAQTCPQAASLLMRTVRFPLYPRLGKSEVSRISKVLATLP